MAEAYLVGGVRTPVGRYGGALSGVRADDLAALVVGEVVRRAGLDPAVVDEVVLGAANQAGDDNRNVARMAALLAGLPVTVAAYTVNRLCASGLTAIANAALAVKAGEADVVVAGGVESMTRAPWVMAKPGTPWAKPGDVFDTALGWRFVNSRHDPEHTITLGETAERVAALDKITREESDAYGLQSQDRAAKAIANGAFDAELVAVPTAKGDVVADETPRATTMDRLAALKPAFAKDGVVTAGSSSPLSDGASAVLVVSEAALARYGLTPRARVVTAAAAGVEPSLMGLGPVPATEKALARVGWSVADLDAVELNEAFAVQVIASARRLGLDEATLNADGGAIALGHPLGSSGARLVVTLLGRLEREQGRRGLATMCVGVGQGASLLVERL
ncbi:thiolase family protein [Lapillicoccus sp.]|uniref:thiolase family protein n=1 Tax=Lapillicoccus sp. TaxID=1909287 RepID=UPI0039839496